MAISYTLSIDDPSNALGSNVPLLTKDIGFVVGLLGSYLDYKGVLDLRIEVRPNSSNPFKTDGLLPSLPGWTVGGDGMTLAALVEATTGIDPNGAGYDAGFTIYLGNDGTVKNYGASVWFDPNPLFGVTPNVPSGKHDFVSIAMHEFLHCFGFASWPEQKAPWNQHTVQKDGVWYFSSPAVRALLGGDLPVAPLTGAGGSIIAGDHIGNTSLSYQPVRSDAMYQWGNYEQNRWDLGQLDLIVLKDLGWTIHNYQDLPLVDPIDTANLIGTAADDAISANIASSAIDAGAGNDTIVLPGNPGNGNYFIKGGAGTDKLVVNKASSLFNVVPHGQDYLLQNVQGTDGVSLLDTIELIQFLDKTINVADEANSSASHDFNGDGTSDILFSSNGAVNAFQVANFAATAWQGVGSYNPAGGDAIAGVGDLNGNGTADVLFFNASTGVAHAFQVNNFHATAWQTVGDVNPAAGYSIAGVGDFNSDGTSDILFQNNGALNAFQVSNYVATAWRGVGSFNPAAGYEVAGVGDFNGDGTSDVLLYNPTNGALNAFQINNFQAVAWQGIGGITPAAGFHIAGIGDFNNDGTDDILFYNPTNGALNAFEVHNFVATAWQGVGSIAPAGGDAVAGVGDFNGNGTADVLFYNQGNGGVHAFQVSDFGATAWQGVGGVSTDWHLV
jgi:hypothetical protein